MSEVELVERHRALINILLDKLRNNMVTPIEVIATLCGYGFTNKAASEIVHNA